MTISPVIQSCVPHSTLLAGITPCLIWYTFLVNSSLLFSQASGAGNHQGVLLLFSSARPVYAMLDQQPPLEHERKAYGPSAKKTWW